MSIKKSITKDEINELPLMKRAHEVKIITSTKEASTAAKTLSREKVLGFDTETRPAFKKGESYLPCLLQLSGKECTYLFRIHQFKAPKELTDLLSNPNIIKTGVAVRDDIIGLKKVFKFTEGGFIELVDEIKKLKITNYGLRALTAIFLGKRLSKKAKLSNWESEKLTKTQIDYAALDSKVGLEIYNQITKINKEYKDD